MENVIVADEKEKPVFDEQTLAKLLEAAFVLQEHSRELDDLRLKLGLNRRPAQPKDAFPPVSSEHEPAPLQHASPILPANHKNMDVPDNPDSISTVERVAEIQHEIELQHLHMDDALSTITANLIEICGAAGAAAAIVESNTVCYRAVAGFRTLPAGSSVVREKALCFPCLRTGQVFRCPDVDPQFLVSAEECRRRGIGSLIAAPVFRNGGIAGSLELYYSDPRAFTEQDVQTCQLMAGVISELLQSDGGTPERNSAGFDSRTTVEQQPVDGTHEESNAALEPVCCYKCGHKLVGEEQFCGQCGAARSTDHTTSSMQSKVASLWHMQQAQPQAQLKEQPEVPGEFVSGDLESNLAEPDRPVEAPVPEIIPRSAASSRLDAWQSLINGPVVEESSELNVERSSKSRHEDNVDGEPSTAKSTQSPADWSSALSTREFLEQFGAGNRKGALAQFWNARRGDVYLAVAVVLVAGVIRWGIWSDHPEKPKPAQPTTKTAIHKRPPAPEISVFDRMLISLGLAEAPQPPADKGDPGAQVWVDLRTGLYYCPGTEFYGKTPKGKYTTQRDAQLDRFEPAYRKNCN